MMQSPLFLHRAWADGHDKIGGRRCTYVLDSVFVVRMHESYRTRSKVVTRAVHRQFYYPFANQPHFGVHVMVRRMGVLRRAAELSRALPAILLSPACPSGLRESARCLAFESVACRKETSPTASVCLARRLPRSEELRESAPREVLSTIHVALRPWFSPFAAFKSSFRQFEPIHAKSSSTSRGRIFSMPSFVKRQFTASLRDGDAPRSERTYASAGKQQPGERSRFARSWLHSRTGDEPCVASSRGDCVSRSFLHCRHRCLGTSVLLRLHGPAVWLDAGAGDLRQCFEQISGGPGLRIYRWLDGGSLRAAQSDDGGNSDGRGSAGRTWQRIHPRGVLFFLRVKCIRLRLWRAPAESGVVVTPVSEVARKGDGFCLFGNRPGRRSGAVDFARIRTAVRLAGSAQGAGSIACIDRSPSGLFDQRRSATKRESRAPRIAGVAKRLHENSLFSTDPEQHVFHRGSEQYPAEFEAVLDPGSQLYAEPGNSRCVAGIEFQHRRAIADGLAGGPLSQEVCHAADILAHRSLHSSAICGAIATGHVRVCGCLWDWSRRGLHDRASDDRGNLWRAASRPVAGSDLDCGQCGRSGVSLAAWTLA